MKALIMAGGFGKRLRPLTSKVPKSMAVVGGKPVIYWQIKWLESLGVNRFVLLGGYKAGKLISYIKSIGYSKSFEYSIEKHPLGSAGAINNARKYLKGEKEFLVVNGDNITNIDIRKLKLGRNFLCCMAIVPYKSSKGIVKLKGNVITGFEEKPLIEGYWFNAGVILVSAKLLGSLPTSGGLENLALPKIAKKGTLSCVKFGKSYFNSVDSLKDMEDIDRDLKSGRVKF